MTAPLDIYHFVCFVHYRYKIIRMQFITSFIVFCATFFVIILHFSMSFVSNWSIGVNFMSWAIFLTGASWPAIHPMTAVWIPPVDRSKFMSNMMASSLGAAVAMPICGFLIEFINWQSAFYFTGKIKDFANYKKNIEKKKKKWKKWRKKKNAKKEYWNFEMTSCIRCAFSQSPQTAFYLPPNRLYVMWFAKLLPEIMKYRGISISRSSDRFTQDNSKNCRDMSV